MCLPQRVETNSLPVFGASGEDLFKAQEAISSKISLQCVDPSTIHIISVQYGLVDKKICPKPSSFVFYANKKYCDSVGLFFESLKKK